MIPHQIDALGNGNVNFFKIVPGRKTINKEHIEEYIISNNKHIISTE